MSSDRSATHARLTGPAARLWVVVIVVVSTATGLRAHEGHEPLPTKGVEVDTDTGALVVSRAAVDALQIEVAEATLGELDVRILAYARLMAPWDRHAFVAPGISGRVTAVFAKPGETVGKGQPLAAIESLDLETIQLELLTARAERLLAEQTLARLERLAAVQIAAARELGEARATAERTRVATAAAVAKLRTLGVSSEVIARLLEDADGPVIRGIEVTSPVAGTVVHGDVTVGTVAAADAHLFEIVDTSELWVKIEVLERDVSRVRPGQSVELTVAAYPDEPVAAVIDSVGLMLDPMSSMGTVWARVTNPPGGPPRFVPGMHGKAWIATADVGQRVAVPAEAIVSNGLERYVFVEEAATAGGVEYRRQNVVVEAAGQGAVLLRDGGVYPGDRVVTKGSHQLATFFFNEVLRLSPEAEAAMGLRLEVAVSRPVEEVLEFDGAVDVPPGARAEVAPQIGGRITAIDVARGRQVATGNVLAELSSLELIDMQQALGQAAAQQRLDASTLARLRSLEDPQSVPRKRLLEAETALLASTTRVDGMSRKLRSVGMAVEDVAAVIDAGQILSALPIRAPIGGSVVRFNAVLGQVMQPEEPLLEIHDPRHVWVRGHLTERDFGRLAGGPAARAARVRFVAAPDRVLTGRVVRSGNVLGSDDRTLSVWVELDAPSDVVLQHNMLARVAITLVEPPPVLAVPLSAVVEQGTRSHVFVRSADGVYVRRAVELGQRDDRFVAVVNGVTAGEQVVVAGADGLQTAFASIR